MLWHGKPPGLSSIIKTIKIGAQRDPFMNQVLIHWEMARSKISAFVAGKKESR
jgi:hypothetical protein